MSWKDYKNLSSRSKYVGKECHGNFSYSKYMRRNPDSSLGNCLSLFSFSLFFVVSYVWYNVQSVRSDVPLFDENAMEVWSLENIRSRKNVPRLLMSEEEKQLENQYVEESVLSFKWRYVVVHHSGVSRGNLSKYDQFHRAKYHRPLLYHFVIGNGSDSKDGEIEMSPRWLEQRSGGHVRHANLDISEKAIGICLVGNFEEQLPSEEQLRQLVRLTIYLMKTFEISADRVVMHNDVGKTLCPGNLFPVDVFFDMLQKFQGNI